MDNTIPFYSSRGPNGFLCNLYPATIVINGVKFPTVEHYFQAMKSGSNENETEYVGSEYSEKIRNRRSAVHAARAGGSGPIRPDWDEIRDEVMERAVTAKFVQHPKLMTKLKETGTSYLYERCGNPYCHWGNQTNTLGKILMKVRDN